MTFALSIQGQLVGVIGKVGSGKSSLLAAISAEMTRECGAISVANLGQGFGLATQDAWIQHATLRDNVLFGEEYDLHKYQLVLEACALQDDIKVRTCCTGWLRKKKKCFKSILIFIYIYWE